MWSLGYLLICFDDAVCLEYHSVCVRALYTKGRLEGKRRRK